MKKNNNKTPKNILKKITIAMMLSTILGVSPVTTIHAQPASTLAVQLAKNTNTAYKPAEIKQPGGTIYFDGKPIDMMGTTILNANSSTLLPIAPIAKTLNTEPMWDAENKVAKISYNGHYAECVQGSDKVILDGNSTKQSAVPTINHNSRVYLPLRTLSESLGLNVSYDANTKNVYITTSQAKPVEPLPTQEIPNPYNVTVPEKYKNTTWLETYNDFRDTYGCTHEQAMKSMQYVQPAPRWESDNSNRGDIRIMSDAQRAHYNQIAKANTIARRSQQIPAPTDKGYRGELRPGGWLFDGTGWTNGDGMMAGTPGLMS